MNCHEPLRQSLWLSAGSVPVAAGAYAVHSVPAIQAGLLSFAVLSFFLPFLFFVFQKRGFGAAWGVRRSAVHIVWWAVVLLTFLGVLALSSSGEERLWEGAHPALMTAAAVVILSILVTAMVFLDYGTLHLYDRLRKGAPFVKEWLALTFFIGLVPAAALFCVIASSWQTFLLVYEASPQMALMEAAQLFPMVLLMKAVLAMVSIAVCLVSSGEGSRWQRNLTAVFTALLWLIFTYAPFVLSMEIPGEAPWRLYLDPSYLSAVPLLSDLWTTGLSLYAGRNLSRWIFSVK